MELFFKVVKYNNALEEYRHQMINDTTNVNEHLIKGIYWTVTEHGFSYCAFNCLKKNRKLKDKTYNNTKHSSIDAKRRLTDMFLRTKLLDFTNNQTLKLDDFFSEIKPVIDNKKPKTEIAPVTKIKIPNIDLRCGPYANETHYDFLRAIKKRRTLKGIAEPDLITIFDRSKTIDMHMLRKKLFKMKNKVRL